MNDSAHPRSGLKAAKQRHFLRKDNKLESEKQIQQTISPWEQNQASCAFSEPEDALSSKAHNPKRT